MTFSRADELALRRRLLVLDASVQRLRLRRDADVLAATLNPVALALRAWQRVRTRPTLALLPLAALASYTAVLLFTASLIFHHRDFR